MEGARVIKAAARFAEHRAMIGEQAPTNDGTIISINALREQRKSLEAIVEHAVGPFIVILESHGYAEDADVIRSEARRLARQGVLTRDIRLLFDDYFQNAYPGLYRFSR